MGLGLGVRIPVTNGPYWQAPRESDVSVPRDMIAIADAFFRTGAKMSMIEGEPLLTRNDLDIFGRLSPRDDRRFAEVRHGGKLNRTFCDSHVEGMKVGGLYFASRSRHQALAALDAADEGNGDREQPRH